MLRRLKLKFRWRPSFSSKYLGVLNSGAGQERVWCEVMRVECLCKTISLYYLCRINGTFALLFLLIVALNLLTCLNICLDRMMILFGFRLLTCLYFSYLRLFGGHSPSLQLILSSEIGVFPQLLDVFSYARLANIWLRLDCYRFRGPIPRFGRYRVVALR